MDVMMVGMLASLRQKDSSRDGCSVAWKADRWAGRWDGISVERKVVMMRMAGRMAEMLVPKKVGWTGARRECSMAGWMAPKMCLE